jgi:hypothetical protein
MQGKARHGSMNGSRIRAMQGSRRWGKTEIGEQKKAAGGEAM